MSDVALLYIPSAVVNDGDNFQADAQFKDSASDTLSAPGSVDFRIDDVTDPNAPVKVQDWTSATASDSVSIQVVSSSNAIITSTNATETKQLTVTGDKGGAFEVTAQKQWIVRNRHLGA